MLLASITETVNTFVACAGSRNISLVEILLRNNRIKVINHFEEREASFLALGVARKTKKPAAIVCTSGTAVSECFSAVIEAYYSGVALVVISADRPKRFRNTGAPQAIEQRNIFGPYAKTIDIDLRGGTSENSFDTVFEEIEGPLHINICLEEMVSLESLESAAEFPVENPEPMKFTKDTVEEISTFLSSTKNPIVILGELHHEDRRLVESFVARLGAPIYAEAHSGLRESKILDPLLVKGSDRVVSKALDQKLVDGVLRIGGVPILRAWRDLEAAGIDTLSIGRKPFSGSPGSRIFFGDFAPLLAGIEVSRREKNIPLHALDQRGQKELVRLLYEFPFSEPGLVYALSHNIHEHDEIFIGNSLPIREWDLAASHGTGHPLLNAQRGANGIDGQLSNFFGGLDANRHNWGIFWRSDDLIRRKCILGIKGSKGDPAYYLRRKQWRWGYIQTSSKAAEKFCGFADTQELHSQ